MKYVCHLMSDAIEQLSPVAQKSVGDLRIYEILTQSAPGTIVALTP